MYILYIFLDFHIYYNFLFIVETLLKIILDFLISYRTQSIKSSDFLDIYLTLAVPSITYSSELYD